MFKSDVANVIDDDVDMSDVSSVATEDLTDCEQYEVSAGVIHATPFVNAERVHADPTPQMVNETHSDD